MPAVPRIRVAQQSVPWEATYKLSGTEQFRLDAASFTLAPSAFGDFVIPVLQCATANGSVYAEIAAPAIQPPVAAANTPLSTTLPSAFTDNNVVPFPGGVCSYDLENFTGSGANTVATFTWPQPPATLAQRSYVPIVDAGVPAMGALVGQATATNSNTVTVTLFGGIAAGSYAYVHLLIMAPDSTPYKLFANLPTVTDSGGVGTLETAPNQVLQYASVGVTPFPSQAAFSGGLYYRLAGPLNAGATITVTFASLTPILLIASVNEITGTRSPHPAGLTAPNTTVADIGFGTTSPTQTVTGMDPWNSGVIVEGIYKFATSGTINVQYARGIHSSLALFGNLQPSPPFVAQVRLPELHISPGDVLTMFATDDTSMMRTGDVITSPLIWGVDDPAEGG